MIRTGLYGINGHQIHQALAGHPVGRLTALAHFPEDQLPAALRNAPGVHRYDSLDEMIRAADVDLVVLCSPRRADQGSDAIKCLRAGKHVLAEKPCANSEAELDAILAAARESGRVFREMTNTAFEQPYLAMREIVRSGSIGEVIQVVAEKSYPWHPARAQDEAIDGGIIAQCAIHALRFVEHVAGTKIKGVRAVETRSGNPVPDGGLRMAAVLMMTLENGGLASIAANYLNPSGTGIWGDESLRILGTRGLVESRGGGSHTRLVIGPTDHGAFAAPAPRPTWLDTFLGSLLGRAQMPLPLDEELSPTRWAIRANHLAKSLPPGSL